MIECRIVGAWKTPELYEDACDWIENNFAIEDACIDWRSGDTYLNGKRYAGCVRFKNHIDATMFKMKYSDFVC